LPSLIVVGDVDEVGEVEGLVVVLIEREDVDEVNELVVLAIDCQYVCQKCSSASEHAGVGIPSSLVDRVTVATGSVNRGKWSTHVVVIITQVRESEVRWNVGLAATVPASNAAI
jgi:hypothetical protein